MSAAGSYFSTSAWVHPNTRDPLSSFTSPPPPGPGRANTTRPFRPSYAGTHSAGLYIPSTHDRTDSRAAFSVYCYLVVAYTADLHTHQPLFFFVLHGWLAFRHISFDSDDAADTHFESLCISDSGFFFFARYTPFDGFIFSFSLWILSHLVLFWVGARSDGDWRVLSFGAYFWVFGDFLDGVGVEFCGLREGMGCLRRRFPREEEGVLREWSC